MSSRAPLRLAFKYISRNRWAGGHNYLRNLFAALAKYQTGEFTIVLFAAPSENDGEVAEFESMDAVEVIRCAAFEARLHNTLSALFLGLDAGAASSFNQHNVNVVIEIANFYGWKLKQPSVAWFPDLQHRHLPHLFPPLTWMRRELGFRTQIAAGRLIFLSSEDARRDCEIFYPNLRDHTSVVRFAAQPETELLNVNSSEVSRLYGLPRAFFYLPNQFWVHKNHRIVLDALALLLERNVDVVVAASGNPEDPRNLGHFRLLMAHVSKEHLADNFRYLGIVPRPHVYSLMRSCVALINPSRFEGWSTTVEEAKVFGVPLILSDIGVHREQTEGKAKFFRVDDAPCLARHLETALKEPPPGERQMLPSASISMAAFAEDFANVIYKAHAHVRGQG